MKLIGSVSNPPFGALIAIQHLKGSVKYECGEATSFLCEEGSHFKTEITICRYLARKFPQHELYGSSVLEMCEVDHWLLNFSGSCETESEEKELLLVLDAYLQLKGRVSQAFLVGKNCTIADYFVWGFLHVRKDKWKDYSFEKIEQYYKMVGSLGPVKKALSSLSGNPKNQQRSEISPLKSKDGQKSVNVPDNSLEALRKEEGKFVDLPGAEMGKVVVRFPPEASGYLHIGHAKAALLNQYYKEAFNGTLIMRFDDTNPAKEKVDFEEVILGDLKLLKITPDRYTYTSDYFDIMLGLCEKMLHNGTAYVDDTDSETLRSEREQKIESKHRNNSVEKNLSLWSEMKNGSEMGLKCCVRAKIDMQSLNGCMRDPTIYRCKLDPHPRTGNKYKVYPTYDFACPIVDSIEGVTHCLRTMEYHDRDAQFYWFIDVLGLRKPHIWEYSRLNMTNTVLSKRKLTWFVDNNIVQGWDDPRMPTVRGILRRGLTVEGLKQFVVAQGSSRSVVVMEWDKIWAFNKKVIDPVAARFTAVEKHNAVPVLIRGATEEVTIAPKHPKNPEIGEKTVWTSPIVWIDQDDANDLMVGNNVTFINWGNIKVEEIVKDGDGVVKEVKAVTNLDNKDFKKTLKLTWLGETSNAPFIPCVCVYFNHIISKPVLGKDEDFKQFIIYETQVEVPMLGDPELASIKKSDIIQLQRKGFFICDSPYRPTSIHSGKPAPIILFHIPDGHAKEIPHFKSSSSVPKKQTLPSKISASSLSAETISENIKNQGDKVRILKQQKVEKATIDAEVKILLSLKEEYKKVSGKDWKPQAEVPKTNTENVNINVEEINYKIVQQGDVVRNLKSQKASKAAIDDEIKILLSLKEEYKKATGKDWKPKSLSPKSINENNEDDIHCKILQQGDLVRKLKSQKADKCAIDAEVKELLALKEQFKKATGKVWQPQPAAQLINTASNVSDIDFKIVQQGNLVRNLKSQKADKSKIDAEVKVLLSLKEEYKKVVGKDWKPGETNLPANQTENSTIEPGVNSKSDNKVGNISAKIVEQGNIVRNLKSQKADKEAVNEAVKTLLSLKDEYKSLTGQEYPRETQPRGENKSKGDKGSGQIKQKPLPKEKKLDVTVSDGPKKITRLGLEAKKEENLPEWYSQVLTKGELLEYYDVSGCYILRPWSFGIWEVLRDWFDVEIKKLGVKNCYFPMFVSGSVLEKEKTHIADFAPEVAWVTKSGSSDLAEPIAIRPTSETVMYPAYAKWIQSYRDLPLRLNQWNNVVRWEFKHPQPFLRTREFLWQEGHTAFATLEEAEEEVTAILELYARIYTDLLAVPVVKGRKTEKEKFAGGDYTLTTEAFISCSGRAIQGATSHHLGQNFSKMFEICYEDPETQDKKFVYQNSWGFTTRTIGVLIMVHADNQGLVLPPRVASLQAVIIPCGVSVSLSEEDKKTVYKFCKDLERKLDDASVKAFTDLRENYSPGWKFNHWELKGVPLRLEVGPKDLKANQIVAIRRDNGSKQTINNDNYLIDNIKNILDDIQNSLLAKAQKDLDRHIKVCRDWPDFSRLLDEKNLLLSPFCGEIACEENIKQHSSREDSDSDCAAPSMGAKGLCIPFEQPQEILPSDKCIHYQCKNKPKYYTLFGRSY